MGVFVVTVRSRDVAGAHHLIDAARRLGVSLASVQEEQCFVIDGDLDSGQLEEISRLVRDPLTAASSAAALDAVADHPFPNNTWAVDVAFRPGVTDNEGESLLIAIALAGITTARAVRTVQRYMIRGDLDAERVARLVSGVLANDLVQITHLARSYADASIIPFFRSLVSPPPPVRPRIATIPIRDVSPDDLERISREGVLALDPAEMAAIQRHFKQLGRDPTDGELETLAQTWSEHCSHKTFKARIDYHEEGHPDHALGNLQVDGLLRSYLVRATEQVRQPWLLSAFVDNAGIVAAGEDDAISFKVETHNHPSALEPFGGANTGIGGVVRDVLGVSARPIANIDVLCFGPEDLAVNDVPVGVLHPQRVAAGVVAGVRDYGNKLGVPTVTGAVLYDPGYTRNPLVFCGTVGLAQRSAHRTGAQFGDHVVVVGGRTGRDGIHGATFSSEELTHQTADVVGSAVQIGDPITEKTMIDVLLQASERGLYRAITDCGAGGLSSAVGEMGEQTGVVVDLQSVPLKYPGLLPWEIWLSEAQERMVVAVPPATLDQFLALCRGEHVAATVIGQFTDDRRLLVRVGEAVLVDLEMEFVHDGRPQRHLQAVWQPASRADQSPKVEDAASVLLRLLSHPNIASKEPIVRTYDHLVQGRTVMGPFGGYGGNGPTDGAVLQIRHERTEAIALGLGINPRYGLIDPYWMALAACDEAVRNVVAVGGDPQRISLLDNFCWGDPRHPDRLGGLVRATVACHDAAVAWKMPFISGKDSLNNEYRDAAGDRVPIPPTLLISALGMMDDLRQTTTQDLKTVGNRLYLVGLTKQELGGSHRMWLDGQVGASVPRVDLPTAYETFLAVHRAIVEGVVAACHDLSEGGLGVAAAEMVIGSGAGLELRLHEVPFDGDATDGGILWSESPSRFLIEVASEGEGRLIETLGAVPHGRIGHVTGEARLRITGLNGATLLDVGADRLRAAWHRTT